MERTTLAELDRLAAEASREHLPELLGAVVQIEARLRLRLAEVVPVAAAAPAARTIDADEAATIAGTSKRWLLAATKGQRFRCDLSRKRPRLEEAGFRAWLAKRGR